MFSRVLVPAFFTAGSFLPQPVNTDFPPYLRGTPVQFDIYSRYYGAGMSCATGMGIWGLMIARPLGSQLKMLGLGLVSAEFMLAGANLVMDANRSGEYVVEATRELIRHGCMILDDERKLKALPPETQSQIREVMTDVVQTKADLFKVVKKLIPESEYAQLISPLQIDIANLEAR
eukprot:PhF_6_TR39886/c0_g1_i1/m.59296